MEGVTALPINTSPLRRIQKRKPKEYSTCLLYNTAEVVNKLKGLKIAMCNPSNEEIRHSRRTNIPERQNEFVVQQRSDFTSVSEKMSCNYCSVVFGTRIEQKHHYQSDWHRYNLKQRLKGDNLVTAEEFESLSGCVSSISGSESESSDTENDDPVSMVTGKPRSKPIDLPSRRLKNELDGDSSNDSDSEFGTMKEDLARKYLKVYFQNSDGQVVSLYRCVIHHKKHQPASHSELITMAEDVPSRMTWAVFMASGGHFAGVIFDKDKILLHKTFHRYIVRAKRGSAQSSRDNQGNAPRSAGASLRRYNETALKEDIQELIESWESQLSKCDLIFLRAPGFNKRIFFSGKSPPLKKDDDRIRMIPFPTKRPTFNEARRVHEMLASVECYGNESDIQECIPMSPPMKFSVETGHLEIVPDDNQTSPQHRKIRDKGKLGTSPLANSAFLNDERETKTSDKIDQIKQKVINKGQQINLIDALVQSESLTNSSAASTGSESELVIEMESLSTMDLKEFGGTKKPKRRKKQNRKRRPSLRHQTEPESDALAEERYHLKNSLYTACKIGDLDTLKNLLAVFTVDQSDSLPVSCADQKSEFDKHQDSKETKEIKVSTDSGEFQDEQPLSESILKSDASHEISSNDIENKSFKSRGDNHRTGDSSEKQENIMSCNIDFRDQNVEINNTDDTELLERSEVEVKADLKSTESDKNEVEEKTDLKSNTGEHSKTRRTNLKLQVPCGSDPSSPRRSRSSSSVSQELLSPLVTVDILNEPIGDSEITLLHVAAKSSHRQIVKKLLEAGADPCIKDKFGNPPYSAANEKETRNEFRRFMARYPTKYDYVAAQVPSPLTAEMEADKRKKESERKRAQKKAKQERLKDQKVEELKTKAEEEEKKRYLSLSDREKRALAAERRLLQQKTDEGVAKPVLSRCFQCGSDMTGKVPFEYFDFKFCSPKCLQLHRKTTQKR